MSSPEPTAISAARERAGMTQQQAADIAGVDRVTWARYEIGMRPIPLPTWRYFLHIAGLERIPFRARSRRFTPPARSAGSDTA